MVSTADREARASSLFLAPWFGLALALARLAAVYAMDRHGRGLDLDRTLWRVGERAGWVLAWALATAAFGAWILRGERGAPWRVPLVGAAFLAVLSGYPFDDAWHVPGPGSTRGVVALAVLAAAAFAAACALRVLARAIGRGRSGGVASIARPIPAAAALALCAVLGVAGAVLVRAPGGTMRVHEFVRAIPLDPQAWRVELGRADAPPHAGSLTPSLAHDVDGGEMPALVVPPPGRVAFDVAADESGLVLTAAAGCDLSVARAFATRAEAPTVVFRVRVDGRVVLEHRRTPWSGEREDERAWARAGGSSGIDVAPGARVELETAIDGGGPDAARIAAASGFGGLSLERRTERPRTRASRSAPNVVLVVMDTLRADRTSLVDPARDTTPALARLAESGTTFEAAFATSSWTWPSTASILTGLDPAAHGVVSDAECWLADELDTLPEAAQRAGLTTAAFSGNPLVARSRNFDAGFESFESPRDGFVVSDQLLPSALSWLDAHASVRFFLYLHLVDPHELHRADPDELARYAGPRPDGLAEHALHDYAERLLDGEGRAADGAHDPARVVPPEHARWLSAAYDAAVRAGDRALERVLAKLVDLGIAGETLVVFTSDHGEEFLDHGLLQHGQSVHTELVHAPLVIAGPGFAAGARVATPVSNRHLAPTLARVFGARLHVDDALDLAGTIEPRPIHLATDCGWLAGRRDVPLRAIRADGFALHALLGSPDGARLYDLAADPGERRDVAAAHPDLAAALYARIVEHDAARSALRPRAVRAGAGTRELLRATGYAGEER